MTRERLQQAIDNNARWCDAVCRSHGRPGEFRDGLWINPRETPRFHPNAVTLTHEEDPAAQLRCIHDLVAAGLAGAWAVKDSFRALDLAPIGFRPLFDAEWICRPASPSAADPAIDRVRWARIEQAGALAAWEAAWRGDRSGREPVEQARVFLPSLLDDRDIAVLAAFQEQRIIAGAIVSRTEEVVGLSNVFGPEHEAGAFLGSCVARVADLFPGLPIVGYESGASLAEAQPQGFQSLGPLRIWVREAHSG